MTTRDRDIAALNFALKHSDVAWGYHRLLSAADRTAMDAILVERKHALAFEPGTNEHRFRQLHRDGYQF